MAPYTAPPRATFWQKLGPGGLVTLTLAGAGALLLFPVLGALRRVLKAAEGEVPAPCDAILVLGRRLEADHPSPVFEERLQMARELWRSGFAARIVVAGGLTGRSSRTEAKAGLAWLESRGVPQEALLAEGASQHTLENLFHVRELMRSRGWARLLLVSDPLHLARAKAMALGLRLPVRCIAAEACPPAEGTFGWWRRALSEAFALHWYRTGAWYCRLIRSKAQLERIF